MVEQKFDKNAGGERLKQRIYRQLRDKALENFSDSVAWKTYFRQIHDGRELSRGAAWHAAHEIKWQCMLCHEEAAELDAVRRILFPGLSRYGMTRALLLMALDMGKEVLNEKDRENGADDKCGDAVSVGGSNTVRKSGQLQRDV